jgi:ribosomal protein S18 acetylase RimI-like enzyme
MSRILSMKPAIALLPDLRVERLTSSTANLAAILTIEAGCFPAAWQYPDAEDFFAGALHDPDNLTLGLKAGQVIVGYLLATPYDAALSCLRDADPDMVASDAGQYYVDTIAVLPEWNGRGGATSLMRELEREAAACELPSLAIHARTLNGLNALVRRLAGERLIRTRWLDNWSWADGEPYEYIEWWCDR